MPAFGSPASGNVLFIALIATGIFAALSYAVTNSQRNTGNTVSSEKEMLSQAVLDSYMASINVGMMRLKFQGCSSIDYTTPSGWGAENHNCHLFHPDGGQVIYQDLGLNECDISGKILSDLNIGEACGNTVYAGVYSGYRLYTTTASFSAAPWQDTPHVFTNTTSADGLANTDKILSMISGNSAAATCRALGEKWFLPTLEELRLIYTNRTAGKLAGTFDGGQFWTSRSFSISAAAHAWVNTATNTLDPNNNRAKTYSYMIRCMRRD